MDFGNKKIMFILEQFSSHLFLKILFHFEKLPKEKSKRQENKTQLPVLVVHKCVTKTHTSLTLQNGKQSQIRIQSQAVFAPL